MKITNTPGGAFLNSREVGGPGGSEGAGGRGKIKIKNKKFRGPSLQDLVPVEKKIQILITKLA